MKTNVSNINFDLIVLYFAVRDFQILPKFAKCEVRENYLCIFSKRLYLSSDQIKTYA